MNQKEFFLNQLPLDRDRMIIKFIQQGWAESSVTAIAWQLKKARKIKLGDDGKWKKVKRGT